MFDKFTNLRTTFFIFFWAKGKYAQMRANDYKHLQDYIYGLSEIYI